MALALSVLLVVQAQAARFFGGISVQIPDGSRAVDLMRFHLDNGGITTRSVSKGRRVPR
jgi:hypothetical protein